MSEFARIFDNGIDLGIEMLSEAREATDLLISKKEAIQLYKVLSHQFVSHEYEQVHEVIRKLSEFEGE